GPGIAVDLGNGRSPHTTTTGHEWEVGYVDVQDVANLLWAAGAEAVSVNRERVVPLSSFYVAGGDLLVGGVHTASPYRIEAIGDGSRMDQALSDDNALVELKNRSQLYQMTFDWHVLRSLNLPAYAGAFVV